MDLHVGYSYLGGLRSFLSPKYGFQVVHFVAGVSAYSGAQIWVFHLVHFSRGLSLFWSSK